MPIAQVKNNGLLDTWGRRNRKLEDIKCKECGKTFRPLRYSSKYCSRKCSWANNGGHNKKPETWWIDNKGYLVGRVWIDGKRVFKRKARWIMENHLGRKLSKYEDVHHINENKVDNRIENIVIISHGGHSSKHHLNRKYPCGYKLNLSTEERKRRSDQAKTIRLDVLGRAAIAKAEGK